LKLVLINFNHPQPLLIVLVDNCLNAGGFSCPGIPKQQAVIRLFPVYKGFRIVYKLLLCSFIAYQIVQMDMGNIGNRENPRPIFRMLHPEGFM